MKQSENIAALAASLVKAQAEMSGAKKSAKNPFFKSTYASLEEVIHCVKTPFANHGLCFVQFPITGEDRAGVETVIIHSSGEFISNEFTLKCAKNDPQGMGSAITYARRYGLQAAAGVPSEDDDGNAATAPTKAPAKKAAPKEPAKEKLITEVQLENIHSLLDKAMFTSEQTGKAVLWASSDQTDNVPSLTESQAAKLIKFITDKITITK